MNGYGSNYYYCSREVAVVVIWSAVIMLVARALVVFEKADETKTEKERKLH
jgi:hypothetical protein